MRKALRNDDRSLSNPRSADEATLSDVVGPRGRVIGGPFGSELTQADYTSEGVPVIRVSNQEGSTVAGDFVFVCEAKADALRANTAHPGDIIVVQRGSTYGKVSKIPLDAPYQRYVVCQSQMAVTVDPEHADPDYVFQYLRSERFQKYIASTVIQTGQPHINLEILRKGPISCPPLPEQRKIAQILRTWDDAVDACDRLRVRQAQVFDATALRTLARPGKARISAWSSVTLTDVCTELTARNSGRLGPDAVMGVNKALGMIPMKDHIRASDLSRYKIVAPNAFAYNPMRLNIGSIARNLHGQDVLVSPDYVAFAVRPDLLHPGFLDHLRRTSLWSNFVKNAGSGGVRVRIYYDDLADFVFNLPPLEEQVAIARFLDTARHELSLLEHRRDALHRQKRGLMQKLLTGQWPVTASKEATA